MKCPHCKENILTELRVGGTVAHVCKECHGFWFKKSELDALKDNIEEHGWYDISLWEKKELIESKTSEHLCPECKKDMRTADWKQGELVVELCPSCGGMWLPKGEYVKAAQYIKEEADQEIMENYGSLISQEIGKVISGEGNISKEVHNLSSLLHFFSSRFVTKHPRLTEIIRELPFTT